MSKRASRQLRRAPSRVPILNGSFCGNAEIGVREALHLFQDGHAELEGIAPVIVNGMTVSFSFQAIKLTFKAYSDIVAGSREDSRSKRTIAEERALHTSDYGQSIASVQREELFHSKPIHVLKKAKTAWVRSNKQGKLVRTVRFRSWNDSDTFPGVPFNPDNLSKPLNARN